MMVQEDFNDDWNWMDSRMFTKEEFDVFLIGRNDPVEMVSLFKNIQTIILKAQDKQ